MSNDIEFLVSLINVKAANSPDAKAALETAATHVQGPYWIVDGETESLVALGVEFEVVSDGYVGPLGGLSQSELIKICKEYLDVEWIEDA